jgi:hypothetical protein
MIPNTWYFIHLFYAFRQLGLLELKFDYYNDDLLFFLDFFYYTSIIFIL